MVGISPRTLTIEYKKFFICRRGRERGKKMNWYDWILLAMVLGIFARLIIFKVLNVHIGVPSSLFTGRLKREKDPDGNSLPLAPAYSEGTHLKPPWWTVENLSRKMVTQLIERQSYQVGGKEGTQGSVDISGIIQYRVSQRMAFRRLEAKEEDIKEGLDAEFDFLLGRELGNPKIKLEKVVTMKGRLSGFLFKQLRRLSSEGEQFPDDDFCGREIDGEPVVWSEQRFGIEILKVNVNRIEPTGELKIARDQRQKEVYQRESETVEWQHILARAKELREQHPKLSDQEVLKEIQTWRGLANREIIDAPDFGSALLGIISKWGREEGKK